MIDVLSKKYPESELACEYGTSHGCLFWTQCACGRGWMDHNNFTTIVAGEQIFAWGVFAFLLTHCFLSAQQNGTEATVNNTQNTSYFHGPWEPGSQTTAKAPQVQTTHAVLYVPDRCVRDTLRLNKHAPAKPMLQRFTRAPVREHCVDNALCMHARGAKIHSFYTRPMAEMAYILQIPYNRFLEFWAQLQLSVARICTRKRRLQRTEVFCFGWHQKIRRHLVCILFV